MPSPERDRCRAALPAAVLYKTLGPPFRAERVLVGG